MVEMEFFYEQDRVCQKDAAGHVIAEVTFPPAGSGTVNIDHTFVDDSLRGQGVAGKLMEAAAGLLRKDGRQAVLTCSYAVKWFGQHPEYADIVKKQPDKPAF